MNFNTPGKIEVEFRKNLGQMSPYMCLVDSAVKEMISMAYSSPSHTKYLRNIADKNGHTNIHTSHLDLDRLKQLVYMSHIAYINSKSEESCRNIYELKTINQEYKSTSIGDFLRKVIYVVHNSKKYSNTPPSELKKELAEELTEDIFVEYVGYEELLLIDYYRKTRNNILHSSDTILNINNFFGDSLQIILEKFNLQPNNPGCFTEKDVLLLSVAWQSCMKRLCSLCLDINRDILPLLIKKFNHKKGTRKTFSISNTLKQEYLLNDKEIADIMKRLSV